jgi:RNA polymerase sigma-70 factor (ECF subfamily)
MRSADFERLYEEHARPLLNFLHYRTGDRDLAEDLLADTFERVLRGRRRYNPLKASEKTWLYSIALNVLRDHLRRVSMGQRVEEQVSAGRAGVHTGGELEAIEEREELRQALSTLSVEEREVIALRYGADLTVDEIAKVTGQKASTVHGRVYRSLRKLKEQLG